MGIFSKLLLILLTGLTVGTSAVGTIKLLKNSNALKTNNIPEVKKIQSEPQTEQKIQVTKTPTITATTNNAVITAVVAPPTQNTNTCIIILFGKQYDVFSLRSTHSGGNVFTCNTDMSGVYQGQHGTNVSQMQAYLVASTGTANLNLPTASVPNGTIKEDDNDRDDNYENEDD